MKLKKGQIVALTSGVYSDYCLNGHMKVLRDFDTEEQAYCLWREREEKGQNKKYESPEPSFPSFLQREGFIDVLEPEDVVEFWMGDYGNDIPGLFDMVYADTGTPAPWGAKRKRITKDQFWREQLQKQKATGGGT